MFFVGTIFHPFFVLDEIHPRNYTHGCVKRWRTSARCCDEIVGSPGRDAFFEWRGLGIVYHKSIPTRENMGNLIHRFISKCFPRFVSEFGTRFGTNGLRLLRPHGPQYMFFRSCCNRTVVGAASKQICSWRPVRITINFSCPFAHFETHSFYITYIYILLTWYITYIYISYLYHIYYIIYYIIYSLFFAMCCIFMGWISLWMQRTLSMVPWH